MTYEISFLMDQVAGHVTNYLNLREVTASDPTIKPTWHEISYFRPEGLLERGHQRFAPFVPTYVTGNVRAAWEIRTALRTGQPQAMLSNARVGVFFARAFARTPTLIDFDATPRQLDDMPSYTTSVDPKPVERVKWTLAKRMFDAAAQLQAWSEWAKRSAVDDYGIPPEKIIVNPPGVDLTTWVPSTKAEAIGRPVRVLFVGGDFQRKGGDLLLSWLAEAGPGIELHVVTREEVPPRPGLCVHTGLSPNTPELKQLYADADVFVLPSLGECFGIATVEAMAAGLPVVTSDVGGVHDIVDEGANGYIVPSADVGALSSAIGSLVADPALRARFGQRSRQLAEERFDMWKNARRTLAEVKRLADGRGNG